MLDELIGRINELARKKKETGLSDAETAEQAELRGRYLANFRASFKSQLDSIIIERPDGSKKPLRRKGGDA